MTTCGQLCLLSIVLSEEKGEESASVVLEIWKLNWKLALHCASELLTESERASSSQMKHPPPPPPVHCWMTIWALLICGCCSQLPLRPLAVSQIDSIVKFVGAWFCPVTHGVLCASSALDGPFQKQTRPHWAVLMVAIVITGSSPLRLQFNWPVWDTRGQSDAVWASQ